MRCLEDVEWIADTLGITIRSSCDPEVADPLACANIVGVRVQVFTVSQELGAENAPYQDAVFGPTNGGIGQDPELWCPDLGMLQRNLDVFQGANRSKKNLKLHIHFSWRMGVGHWDLVQAGQCSFANVLAMQCVHLPTLGCQSR